MSERMTEEDFAACLQYRYHDKLFLEARRARASEMALRADLAKAKERAKALEAAFPLMKEALEAQQKFDQYALRVRPLDALGEGLLAAARARRGEALAASRKATT